MNKNTRIDLLRHGSVVTPGLFCAPADEPLSECGWQEMEKTAQHKQWDVIITSPYRRCHDFAKNLAHQQGSDLLIVEDFREMDFGNWTGQTRTALWKNEAEALQMLWTSPESFVAPNGEAIDCFFRRVQQAWQKTLKQYHSQHLLLVTHAGVIRTLLSQTLDIPHNKILQFHIAHATLTRLHYYPDGHYSLHAFGKTDTD
jgi:broad specificity phosphatase PhoE